MGGWGDGTVLVTGGGGFIGGHLVARLVGMGCPRVRSVDIRQLSDWYQITADAENIVADLREPDACRAVVESASAVFNLAADMGGMGFIERHKADCMVSVLINTNMLVAARDAGV